MFYDNILRLYQNKISFKKIIDTNMIIKLKAPKIGVKQAIIRVFCLTVNMQKKERCSGTLNG